MLKFINGFILGLWFSGLLMTLMGVISLGFWTLFVSFVIIMLITGIVHVIELISDYKHIYKNTKELTNAGVSFVKYLKNRKTRKIIADNNE